MTSPATIDPIREPENTICFIKEWSQKQAIKVNMIQGDSSVGVAYEGIGVTLSSLDAVTKGNSPITDP